MVHLSNMDSFISRIFSVLEDLKKTLPLLDQNDQLSVADDRRGFHLCRMNNETPEFLSFEYKERVFSYRCLPFGIPKGPGAFQRANMAAVSFLRSFGVKIVLYLDDRLIIDKPDATVPRNSILSMQIITAAGGMISLNKSHLDGRTKEKFLGMNLSTPNCEISVPDDKWTKFRDLTTKLLTTNKILLKDLEKLRGKAISFLLAAPSARLHIRRMTEKITQANKTAELFVQNDDRLREEFHNWLSYSQADITTIWKKELIPIKEKLLTTADASSFSGGHVILSKKHAAARMHTFSEEFARMPIAYKEADAILRMLQTHPQTFYNKELIHFCDNQTVAYAYRNMGSPVPALNDIIRQIYAKLHDLKARLHIYWCSTTLMAADKVVINC